MDQITPLLEKLATQLGVTAENLWGILMLQARIAWVIPTLLVIMFIIMGIVPRYISKKHKDSEIATVLSGLGIASYLAALIPGIIAVWYVFMAIVNPAYLALNKILSVLTPIAK